jgi:aspartate aminotransferase
MIEALNEELNKRLPGIIVSSPDASIYSVVDVRKVVGPEFDAEEFVLYCAREGWVEVGDKKLTLLVAPMAGFYSVQEGEEDPGRTQMRIAYVEPPEQMRLVPVLFSELLKKFIEKKKEKIARVKTHADVDD